MANNGDVEIELHAPNEPGSALPAPVNARGSEMPAQPAPPDPPEGGYGWVVLACCSILNFFSIGTVYSWGVIQSALLQASPPLAPASTLAFIGSLTASCVAFFAIVNARLIRGIGARNASIVGTLLLGGGEVLSGWCTRSIGGLFVTSGLVMGMGTSLCFMVCSVVPGQFFPRRKGLAIGIVYAGGGVGGAAISLALDALHQRVGLPWTFRIAGFITLAIALPASLLVKERPIISAQPRSEVFIDWRLFKDTRFLTLFAGSAVATLTLFVPPFFLPLYAASLSLSSTRAALLLAGYSLSSALGRLAMGSAADVLGAVNALAASLVLTGLSMLVVWPLSTSIAPLVVFVVLNGVSNGGFFALMPTVVLSVFGPGRVRVAMGMVVTGWAGGYLMGAPIAGYILAAYGGTGATPLLEDYRPAMYYAGSMALGSAGLVGVARSSLARGKGMWARV